MTDVVAVVRRLPRGLCGVVFRHDGVPGRAVLAGRVAQICRQRRLTMVMAGEGPRPIGTGMHLREGRGHAGAGLVTGSAHGVPGLVRAWRAGAGAVFLSPVFETASHEGVPGLGLTRWALLGRHSRVPVFALGGVDGMSVRRLPRWVAGAGAIAALSG